MVVGSAQRLVLLRCHTPSGTTTVVFITPGDDATTPLTANSGANISAINTTTAVSTYVWTKTSTTGTLTWNSSAAIGDFLVHVIAYM